MKTLYILILLVVQLFPGIICRPLNGSTELVSDGVYDQYHDAFSSYSLIQFKGSVDDSEDTCEEMYNILPCSKSIQGHFMMILVYEFLLFYAESCVATGGKTIFKILGPGVFGASAFQIIGCLPEALILLASGLSSSHEIAQERLVTGVGLLAGSSILLLTLIWGTCILLGSQKNSNLSSSDNNILEKFLFSLWPGYGVITDMETSCTSRIMLSSVIPLLMIQTLRIFPLSYAGERIIIVILVLVISILFLLGYFVFQFFQPWIQRRRLLYIKHEHLVVDILKHVQNLTAGNLLNDNGAPNISAIRKLFEERDLDGDMAISFSELKEFLQDIELRKVKSEKNNTTAEILKEFDIDNDWKINEDEFVIGMTRWLDDTKDAMNKRYHSIRSLKDMYQVLRPWIQKKREEREMMKSLIPDILDFLQTTMYGSLLAENGTPDIQAIKRLFNEIDLNRDEFISYDELKEMVTNIKFGMIPYHVDIVTSKIMKELDTSGDQLIDKDEFINGFYKWLASTNNQSPSEEINEEDNTYKQTWEQIDRLVEDKFIDKSLLAWAKAVTLLVVGVVMLGGLAEPLIHSVRQFSTSANWPSFYVAFVLVPLATSARIYVSAINEARRKKLHTTSLALSEIYGTVFMNNVLGLVVLLSLIYFRGLTWDFSVEVLTVLIVSAITGGIASVTTVFPVWTAILAILMYPLSLVLVGVLGDF